MFFLFYPSLLITFLALPVFCKFVWLGVSFENINHHAPLALFPCASALRSGEFLFSEERNFPEIVAAGICAIVEGQYLHLHTAR